MNKNQKRLRFFLWMLIAGLFVGCSSRPNNYGRDRINSIRFVVKGPESSWIYVMAPAVYNQQGTTWLRLVDKMRKASNIHSGQESVLVELVGTSRAKVLIEKDSRWAITEIKNLQDGGRYTVGF
ncbi:MAG: hypothetical protein ACFBZ8_06155 [Opitutales bacterium]